MTTTTEIPTPIPNFSEVVDGVYRGGQPTDYGWQLLKDMGIKRVIKLDTRTEAPDDETDFEVLSYELAWWEQILGPREWKIKNAVDTISDVVPTYVHCLHGQDRTGLVIACYRVWRQGWNKADAEKEMLDAGFHKSLVGLWWFWRTKV